MVRVSKFCLNVKHVLFISSKVKKTIIRGAVLKFLDGASKPNVDFILLQHCFCVKPCRKT